MMENTTLDILGIFIVNQGVAKMYHGLTVTRLHFKRLRCLSTRRWDYVTFVIKRSLCLKLLIGIMVGNR